MAEESYVDVKEMLKAFLHIPQPVVITDTHGIIVFVNHAMCELCGATHSELVGEPCSFMCANSCADRSACCLRSRDESCGSDTIAWRKRGGELLRVNVSSVPLLSGQQQIIGRVAIARDLTCQVRELEEQRREISKLEGEKRELSSFAHVLSHELKAPIRSIRGLLRLSLEDEQVSTSPEITGLLQSLAERVDYLNILVTRVLRYSRSVKIGHSEAPERGSIKEVITTVVCALGGKARPAEGPGGDAVNPDVFIVPRYGAALSPCVVAISGADRQVAASETILIEVFQNLLDNAVRHSDHGSGRVIIGIAEQDGKAVVEISDNGSGFSEDVRARLFEPFFTTDRASGGTGLGLSIVKELVERAGGSVDGASAPGTGATFTVVLPILP